MDPIWVWSEFTVSIARTLLHGTPNPQKRIGVEAQLAPRTKRSYIFLKSSIQLLLLHQLLMNHHLPVARLKQISNSEYHVCS